MYADRYPQHQRLNPAGLTAAIAVNAAVVAALVFAAPTVVRELPHGPLRIVDVFLDPPPPPEPQPKPPEQRAANRPMERIDTPRQLVDTDRSTDFTQPYYSPLPPTGDHVGTDPGPVVIADPPPPLLPALIEPAIDPRYAEAMQPVYPASERRASREGSVTIRVLVGVDGRVRQAERIDATSDAFWQATLARALSTWRFKPGTRGGIPVEAWRRLTLTFVLKD